MIPTPKGEEGTHSRSCNRSYQTSQVNKQNEMENQMRLNYIDYADLPLSVMFTKGDIEAIHEFLKENSDAIESCKRPHAMTGIANCFAEIHAKLEEV